MWPCDVHSSDSLARLWPSPPDLPVNFLTPKLLTRWVWVLLWHWWINGEWFLLWLCCSVCFWDSLAMWPRWQRTYTLGLRFAWFQACTKPPCPALKWLKTPKRLALHFIETLFNYRGCPDIQKATSDHTPDFLFYFTHLNVLPVHICTTCASMVCLWHKLWICPIQNEISVIA